MIDITEVRVYPHEAGNGKLKAFVTITLSDSFVVRNLKVIQGRSGLFVAMPSQQLKNGEYKDIAHPVKTEARDYIQEKVLEAYNRKMREIKLGIADEIR
ncbi:MAG: septation protein SpoVG family protein [bacterium]